MMRANAGTWMTALVYMTNASRYEMFFPLYCEQMPHDSSCTSRGSLNIPSTYIPHAAVRVPMGYLLPLFRVALTLPTPPPPSTTNTCRHVQSTCMYNSMYVCVRACVRAWRIGICMCTAHRVRASGCNYAAPVVCIYGLNTNRNFEFKYVRRQQFVRKVCCGGRHEVGSLQWLHAQRIDRSLCMQSIRKYLRVLVSLNASPLFF